MAIRKFLLLLIFLLSFAAEAFADTYVVKKNVYERTGPSTSHEIVTLHNKDETLEVKRIEGDWARLKNGNYVWLKNIAPKGRATETKFNATLYVCVSKANIRTAPSMRADIKEKFEFGTRIKVIAQDGDWYKTKSGYYIHKTCVTSDFEQYCLKNTNTDVVFVSKQEQVVRQYDNGELIYSTKCVTGAAATPTPSGVFKVYRIGRNEKMGNQEVAIAMYFNDGIAIHDASWRRSFGSNVNGSHGCVNVSLNAAETLVKEVRTGTTIIVYD